MKFPIEFGTGEVCWDQATARQCYLSTVLPRKQEQDEQSINQVIDINPRDIIKIGKKHACLPVRETEDVESIPCYPDKTTKIGKDLPKFLKREITDLIQKYSDIFSWGPYDMPGIPEVIARHSLHVNPKMYHVC